MASSSGIFENPLEYSLSHSMDSGVNVEVIENTIYQTNGIMSRVSSPEIFERVNGQSNVMTSEKLSLASKHYSECSILHHIYAPTLLIWVLQDMLTPPEAALAFHEHLPNSKIIFLDHNEHVPMVDQPRLFNQHVRDFLER